MKRSLFLAAMSLLISPLFFSNSCDAQGRRGGLQTYFTTNPNVAQTMPKADGSNGWEKYHHNDNPIWVPGGQNSCIWLAWRNTPNAKMNKYIRVELLNLNGEKFTIMNFEGYEGENDGLKVKTKAIGKGVNPRMREHQFTPCPQWERMKIRNDQPNNQAWRLQADAWSVCAKVRPKKLTRVEVKGAYGAETAMTETPEIKEVVFCPAYSPLDQNVTPKFIDLLNEQNWNTEIVFQDPFGNPRPGGCVRCTTDGAGLQPGDPFLAEMDLEHPTLGLMSIYFIDDVSQEIMPFEFVDYGPVWGQPFDLHVYLPGDDLIGYRGWTGFNDDPLANGGIILDQQAFTPPMALEMPPGSNMVRQFEIQDNCWNLEFMTLIPANHPGGAQIGIFDQYQPNGQQHLGLNIQIVPNGFLEIQCGGNNVQIPYLPDQWMPIGIDIDLKNNFGAVFYDHQPICDFQWTAGAFGDDGGELSLQAIHLFNNGSAPVFYDDFILLPLDPLQTHIEPAQFNVFRGLLQNGDIADLESSDDQRVGVKAGFTLSSAEPPVWMEFSGFTTTPQPQSLLVSLESQANTPNLLQTTELFNFANGAYQQIGKTQATMAEAVFETEVLAGNLSDFVSPAGELRTRVGWKANGIVLTYPWQIDVDQVSWTHTE